MSSKSNAVFLDRDGVLNHDPGYVYRPEDLVLLPGVAKGLKTLADSGFKLIVITNQSGVARGYFSLNDVDNFHKAMQLQLAKDAGVQIDRFYTCPHFPSGSVKDYAHACLCRKPGNKHLLDAMADFQIDATKSFMIGDRESDILAGKASGLTTILIGPEHSGADIADNVVANFEEATSVILSL